MLRFFFQSHVMCLRHGRFGYVRISNKKTKRGETGEDWALGKPRGLKKKQFLRLLRAD